MVNEPTKVVIKWCAECDIQRDFHRAVTENIACGIIIGERDMMCRIHGDGKVRVLTYMLPLNNGKANDGIRGEG